MVVKGLVGTAVLALPLLCNAILGQQGNRCGGQRNRGMGIDVAPTLNS